VSEKDQYAGYLVAFWPITNGDFFARVGYGRFDIHASAGGASGNGGFDTVNYGVGGQWFLNGGHNGFRADYTYMSPQGSGLSGHFNAYSVSYVRKF
jgi:hypothetical protein